jgi:hypothetical protein
MASKTENLVAAMERVIKNLKVPAGKPLVAPSPQCPAPACAKEEIDIHIIGRAGHGGSWGGMAENWVVLDRDDQKQFSRGEGAAVGDSWPLPKTLAAKILAYFYPPTENNTVAKNRFNELTLKATVVSVNSGVVRARLDGAMKMEHSFYHQDDGKMVEAAIIGFADFDPAKQIIRKLQLITDRATYGGGTFSAAATSVP